MKKSSHIKMNWRVMAFTALTLVFFTFTFAQNKPRQLRKDILKSQQQTSKAAYQPPPVGATVFRPANPTNIPNTKLVYIEKTDLLTFDQLRFPDIQILKGNVRFRHDNALLYCDSAYFSDKTNSFDAFGNVQIVQADTLFVYGDYLNYNGNTKLAKLRHNVRMVNRNTVLTTDSLNYDRAQDLAYYYTGGRIVDKVNTLTSVYGQYSPSTKEAFFIDNVDMKNPNFTMQTDSLKYNTYTSVARIIGNTHVIYKNETDIYSKNGWYNTATEQMELLDRSLVEQKDGKMMIGDTIFYDKKKKYGEAYTNVVMTDPKNKSTLYGDYIFYDENKEYGIATDSALMVDWSTKDSLFLNADTLYKMKDSIYNRVEAYKNVRTYRSDIQAMSDSLSYSTRDSILHLTSYPVVWTDNNQLMGNKITAYTKNQKVDKVFVEKDAIAIQKDTLNFYNQMAGKEMTAYIDSGQVKRVMVSGNAESIYFPKDDKTKDIIGVNKTISSFINMYFKDKKIQRIVLTKASSGTMYPLDKMTENDLYHKNFYWYEDERPKKIDDVFLRFAKVEKPKRPESAKKPTFPTEGGGAAATTNKKTNQPSSNSQNRNMNSTYPNNSIQNTVNRQNSVPGVSGRRFNSN